MQPTRLNDYTRLFGSSVMRVGSDTFGDPFFKRAYKIKLRVHWLIYLCIVHMSISLSSFLSHLLTDCTLRSYMGGGSKSNLGVRILYSHKPPHETLKLPRILLLHSKICDSGFEALSPSETGSNGNMESLLSTPKKSCESEKV